jgi:hypothetical protein
MTLTFAIYTGFDVSTAQKHTTVVYNYLFVVQRGMEWGERMPMRLR